MVEPTQFRRGPDRRRQNRGGRRSGDIEGAAPLVLAVGEDNTVVEKAEAILCKLKFGVSATVDANEALRILPDLRPNVIVVAPRHEVLFRTASQLPVVVIPETLDELIENIRRALRVTPINIAQMR